MRTTCVSTALLLGSMLLLTACSTPTILTLNDGREIQAVDTPTYDKASGFYEVEQLDGKTTRINKDQVRTVKEL